ncbi:ABC transporter ATP-binding protein [Anaeromicrobium sediminis]|uniref:ABC transporter ATP-binding protein n=1 Tax=Anaeromicrobium sediminis TaxID=1478221 RepID=UPI001595EEA1|nr:ABC transporter ATP-binding protein [Anaeromicrobium sediminis]
MKKYKKEIILGPFLLILASALDLLQPFLMSSIIDVGIPNKDVNLIKNIGITMVILVGLSLLAGIISNILAAVASQSVATDLRNDTFKKLLSLSYRNLDDLDTGKTITIMTNDITQVQNLILITLNMFIKAPILAIGSVIMAFVTSKDLSWILLVVIPIIFIFIFSILKRAYPLYMAVQKTIDKFNAYIEENLSGIRLVKAFVSYRYEEKKFNNINEKLRNANLKANRFIILILPVIMLIINFSTISILWFGGKYVIDGRMDIGQIMAFNNYLLQILASIMILGMLFITLSRAQASMERIKEFTEIENTDFEDSNPVNKLSSKGSISFKDVSFSYSKDKEKCILKKLNFQIDSGETVGIIGSTGSGKTTLANLIAGLYEPTIGEIYLGDKEVKTIHKEDLRSHVGLAPQKAFLFSGSIEENLYLSNENASSDDLEKAAIISDAIEFINQKPDKFNYFIEEEGNNLSGGQKQRLNIARAVVKNPSILILDDSTSAVDAQTEVNIHSNIKKYMNSTTNLIITQKISSILDADKIIVLNKGKIDGIGTHNDLLENSHVYKSIYDSQIGKDVS